MARHFAERGYRLALTGRKLEDLEQLREELAPECPAVTLRELDVLDFERVPAVLKDCADELGGLDIVVANAGVAMGARTGEGEFESMKTTVAINLTGAIATCEAALALFREQGQGHLVGITSVAALRGMRRQAAYCASKAGFSKYLESARCETIGERITVTELAPGFIDTDLNRSLASRPFLVSGERGTAYLVDLIERRSHFSYVPPWPWTLVAQALKVMPLRLLARM
jgi:NADP-dependent 3-hydroxy acid dehydrogenase YdfG